MTTYVAWDDEEYPWPPPDGWYVAGDGKWWPEGYGPGQSPVDNAVTADPPTVFEPPSQGVAPSAQSVVPPAQGVAPPAQGFAAPVAGVTPPPAATPPPAQAAPQMADPAYAATAAPPTQNIAGGSPPSGVAPPAGSPPPTGSSDGSGSGKILAILGGLLLVVILGVGGLIALLRGGDDDTASATTTVPVATLPDDTATDATTADTTADTTAETTADTTADTTAETVSGSDPTGSFANPYGVGERVVVFYDDFETSEERTWVIEVLSSPEDITQAVADENQFNDPPPDGKVFGAVRVRVTYQSGPAPADIFDLNFNAVGPSGVVLKTFVESCGVTPDELPTFSELFPGGSVEGNVCWAMDPGDLADLTMLLEVIFVDGEIYIDLN